MITKSLTIIKLLVITTLVTILSGCVKEDVAPESNFQNPPLEITNNTPSFELIENKYLVIFKNEYFIAFDSETINQRNYFKTIELFKAEVFSILKEIGLENKTINQTYIKTMKGVALELNQEELNTLEKDERVAYIEQDNITGILASDSIIVVPGEAQNIQTTPWGILRVGGGDPVVTNRKAWIIDSGIDMDHPDLNVNQDLSISLLSDSSTPQDDVGHGTHIAGIIGAIDNGIGVIGVAPGVEVVSVRVSNYRGSILSDFIAGVDYVAATATTGDVANISTSFPPSLTLDNAVIAASASCTFTIAAGNGLSNANDSSPPRVNGDNIFTISGMDIDDNWYELSNFGNPPVDFCAPAVNVYSTELNGGYGSRNGTSMAAPHAAGLILQGGIQGDDFVNGDPDGNPDPIASRVTL